MRILSELQNEFMSSTSSVRQISLMKTYKKYTHKLFRNDTVYKTKIHEKNNKLANIDIFCVVIRPTTVLFAFEVVLSLPDEFQFSD